MSRKKAKPIQQPLKKVLVVYGLNEEGKPRVLGLNAAARCVPKASSPAALGLGVRTASRGFNYHAHRMMALARTA